MPPIPTSEKRPFIPAPGVVQVEMVYVNNNQICENVYHVLRPGGAGSPTSADLDAIAGVFNTWENDHGRTMRNTVTRLTLIRARDLAVQDGLVVEHIPTGLVVGQTAAQPLPGNVTLAIKWSTGLGGRSFRGRTYHVGLSVGDIDGVSILTAARDFIVSNYALLRDNVDAAGIGTLVVLSYAANKFWRAAAVATPILHASADINLDSQRRRLAGRGS